MKRIFALAAIIGVLTITGVIAIISVAGVGLFGVRSATKILTVGMTLIQQTLHDMWLRARAETFTDSTGVQWRILARDEQGNRLIITELSHGLTQYNSTNVYTRLGQSDRLRPVLNAWFTYTLAPELREVALPAENVNNDVRLAPGDDKEGRTFIAAEGPENDSAGWTHAGIGAATPENALFILSVSEVNKYNNLGTLNMRDAAHAVIPTWWLRSPGKDVLYPVTGVGGDTEPGIIALPATGVASFRPALWVSR